MTGRSLAFLITHVQLIAYIQLCTRGMLVEGCTSHTAFGLASGMVPNERISASTTYNSSNNFNHYGASQARLGIASFWCGFDKATWKDDWIQVEFGDSEQITGIAVEKGWENNPHGILSEFYLQFSDDGITFKNQTGENGKSVEHKLSSENYRTEYFWFEAVAAKFVRVRASRLLVTSSSSRFCGKFELFGCNTTKQSTIIEMYKIGLSGSIIPDSKFTASSSISGNPPYHARLNFPNSWCPTTNVDEWLQLDLGQAMIIKGISTQGHYGKLSTDIVSAYLISFANNSGGSFSYIQNGSENKTFFGNNQTSEDPVFNMIESSVVARYLRIHPLTGYNGGSTGRMCMRLEVYASHPVCNADLMSSSKTKLFSVNNGALSTITSYMDVYSNSSWCSGKTINSGSPKATESLRIDLGDINLITGIAISGNPYSDSWVTSFDVAYGLLPHEMESFGYAFVGSDSRVNVAVNWLKTPTVSRYLEVKPKNFVGDSCLRIKALGCSLVPTTSHIPHLLSVNPGVNYITLKIKTTGSLAIKGILIKYHCPDAAFSLSCSKEISSIIPFREIKEDNFNITNLQPWTKYELRLRYIFNDSQSLERNVTNVTTLETNPSQAPGGCNVSSINATAISLRWTHIPINSSNGDITGYQIVLTKSNVNESHSLMAAIFVTTYAISGLDSNTTYRIQIKAVNNAGSGPPCLLDAQTLSKDTSTAGGGATKDTFAINSAIALISCTFGVMLIAITCILTKALHEKIKHNRRKKKSQKDMTMIKNKTMVNFLESRGVKVDDSIASDFESLLRIVRESRKKKNTYSALKVGRSQYFKNLRLSAQSSGSRGGSAKSVGKKSAAMGWSETDDSSEMRKIGFDNSAFGGLECN